MYKKLTDDKIAEFRCAFDLFDTDGDNFISAKELSNVIENTGQSVSQEDLREMIREVDEDGDGLINFDEFLDLMESKMKDNDSEEELMEAFKLFDKNSNNLVSKNEIKQVMHMLGENLSQDEIEDLMMQFDQDRDGFLNYEEFKKMMTF